MKNIALILLIPFMGTALGAATVFFMRGELRPALQKLLLGFASGVMVAASVWSLIVPSIAASSEMGKFAFVPAAVGIALGMAFLFLLDCAVPHLHLDSDEPDGFGKQLKRTTMLVLAVTLHNIPEGMAVGVVVGGLMSAQGGITAAGTVALAVGIAVQNFPEGAIISLPLKNSGGSRGKSFMYGMLSGVVEPLASVLTILLSRLAVPALPYMLAFAAGAMIFVVVEELIPEASEGEHSNNGTIGFGIGFILMMILDVALG